MNLSVDFLVPPARKAPWLEPYWQGVECGELRLPRCSSCQRWQWYPLDSGACCPGGSLEWVAIAPEGTLFTYTEVQRPLLPGVSKPYVTGLVVPDEAPECRIATQVISRTAGDLRIGARMRFAVSPSDDGPVPFFYVEEQA